MPKESRAHPPPNPLEELVDRLLECGGVLSQIISHMVAAQRSGQCDADVAPIPEVARSLVGDVLADLAKRRTDEAIGTAAGIVDGATTLIVDNIVFVPLDVN